MKNQFICESIKKSTLSTKVILNVFDHTKEPSIGKVKLVLDKMDTTFKVGEHYEVSFKYLNHDRRK
jgi:hypothetical protein